MEQIIYQRNYFKICNYELHNVNGFVPKSDSTEIYWFVTGF
jgi:hypothetical protein